VSRWEVAALVAVVFLLGVMVGGALEGAAGPSRRYTSEEVCGLVLAQAPLGNGAALDSWNEVVQRRC
jgi:hypothetical protein